MPYALLKVYKCTRSFKFYVAYCQDAIFLLIGWRKFIWRKSSQLTQQALFKFFERSQDFILIRIPVRLRREHKKQQSREIFDHLFFLSFQLAKDAVCSAMPFSTVDHS
jgi:hypothetical protein